MSGTKIDTKFPEQISKYRAGLLQDRPKPPPRKIHKRVRFDINPLFDRDESTADEEMRSKYIYESEVLEEDPIDPTKGMNEPLILTENDFWEFVYGNDWDGRLRVNEGNLQRTLIRTFDDLIANRKIGWTESCRYYKAIQLRGRSQYTVGAGNLRMRAGKKKRGVTRQDAAQNPVTNPSSSQTKYGAVKVVLTFYGGKPLGKRRKVSFDTRGSVDTSPRLTRFAPILKGHIKSKRLQFRRAAIIDEDKAREDIEKHFHDKKMQFFAARTPKDFAQQCVRASNDFVVTKEQILNSKDWKIRTSITISRKVSSRFGLARLSDALPRFFEGKTMVIC